MDSSVDEDRQCDIPVSEWHISMNRHLDKSNTAIESVSMELIGNSKVMEIEYNDLEHTANIANLYLHEEGEELNQAKKDIERLEAEIIEKDRKVKAREEEIETLMTEIEEHKIVIIKQKEYISILEVEKSEILSKDSELVKQKDYISMLEREKSEIESKDSELVKLKDTITKMKKKYKSELAKAQMGPPSYVGRLKRKQRNQVVLDDDFIFEDLGKKKGKKDVKKIADVGEIESDPSLKTISRGEVFKALNEEDQKKLVTFWTTTDKDKLLLEKGDAKIISRTEIEYIMKKEAISVEIIDSYLDCLKHDPEYEKCILFESPSWVI